MARPVPIDTGQPARSRDDDAPRPDRTQLPGVPRDVLHPVGRQAYRDRVIAAALDTTP